MSKHNTCTLLWHALVMCLQLGSSMGKLLCEKLSSKMPGVVKQATRALCNMWCCPEVVPEVGGQQLCTRCTLRESRLGSLLNGLQCFCSWLLGCRWHRCSLTITLPHLS